MAWRALWRPSLVLASFALLGIFYFLAVVPDGPSVHAPPVPLGEGSQARARVQTTDSVDGYLVWNPSCHIPDTDPYDSSIRKFLSREDPVVCSGLPPLTTTRALKSESHNASVGTGGARQHILQLDVSLLPKYRPRFYNNVTCCYSTITRIDPSPDKLHTKDVDDKYKIGRCESLQTEAQLDADTEFVLVRCSAKQTRTSRTKKVYTNVHAVVAPKEGVRAKLRQSQPRPPGDSRLSVLVVGIDSLSRLNYFRTMPRTSDLLRSTGWYDLRGYNKIEDNTFPNVMAILTGMSYPQVVQRCFKNRWEPMDDCPFLWKNFSREGYITAYVEDEPTIGTFNYQKAGFARSPTDYYLRPFLLAAEENLELKHVHRLNACLGPTTAAEHILGFASSLATILKNHLYFAFFWMNSFSHNNINSPSSMDDRMFRFWYDLLKSGALNKTMVIFLSDHGMRFGKIRETEIGWLEERLPFVNMWLPEDFRDAFPELDKGLKANENRLTTPYDLHVSLKDVLHRPWFTGQPPSAGNISLGCPKCSSLFAPVPWDRGCTDASIEQHWCTCMEYRGMSTEDHSARSATEFVVKYIVDLLEAESSNYTKSGMHCARLTLNRVISVRGRTVNNTDTEYIIIFETVPGKAVFETTVRHARAKFEMLGSVSRVNEFWEHSQCISHANFKKYCFCAKNSGKKAGGRSP